jgi:hypothetical protein
MFFDTIMKLVKFFDLPGSTAPPDSGHSKLRSAGTLAAIDEAASARGLTRSAFLASAAREKIAYEAG